MRTLLLILTYLWMGVMAKAQTYQNDLDFLLRQIEATYPGYTFKVKQPEYQQFLQTLNREGITDTLKLLSRVALYFKDKHLLLYDMKALKKQDTAGFPARVQQTTAYLSDASIAKDPHEGFWINEYRNCVMGLRKVSGKSVTYQGVVIESGGIAKTGFMNCELELAGQGRFLTSYTDVAFGYRQYFYTHFENDETWVAGAYDKWRKLAGYQPGLLKKLAPFQFDASLTIVDSETVVIRIPENTGANTRLVDSLVRRHHQLLSTTKQLIIDIRNNQGGTVRTYKALLPYIHTGPIIPPADSIYCSDELITYHEEVLDMRRQKNDTVAIHRLENKLTLMKNYRNRFLFLPPDTIRYDSIASYPQQVGILVNYGCLSAAEMMLLDCRQSRKVTVFGETTGGAVDYLDFFPIITPSGKYVLYMPGVKRAITKDLSLLDDTGIQPDVRIGPEVKDWIKFVKSYYENTP